MSTRAWAHSIVRLYPQAWRERYEAEVRGLIDDAPIQVRDLGELLRGLFTERARELLTSVGNPRRTARIIGLMSPVAGAMFMLLAWLTGFGVQALTSPWSDSVAMYMGLFLMVGLAAFFVTWVRGWMRRDRAKWGEPLSVPPGFVIVLLPMLFVLVGLFAAIPSDDSPYRLLIPVGMRRLWQFLMWASIAGSLLSSLFPGHKLLQAFANLSYTERQIRTNEKWVEGCHDMISRGVASPLGAAVAEVGRWTVERDSARARLEELGYEARFRGSLSRWESGREITT